VRHRPPATAANVPYRVPPASALPQRVPGILAVLYLVFNEGCSASAARRRLEEALAGKRPGQYQIQAAIVGCHAAAPTAQATDWPRIARFYHHLADMTGSPVVELNRAVAVAMTGGPAVGLALLQRLEVSGTLAGYYLLPATRADFLRRLGRNEEAAWEWLHRPFPARTGRGLAFSR
jgi:predicted RNA polymerase sigma factor